MAIYFIRHGQSEFNAVSGHIVDPMIFDAPLSKLGLQQARETRKQITKLEITRAITSPFTRAIQTAQIIFDGIAEIDVRLGHHEILNHSCDIGRTPAQLHKDFPNLKFDHLPNHWWYYEEGFNYEENKFPHEPAEIFQLRLNKFVEDLEKNAECNTAIVGHGNAFMEIIGFMLQNCEIYSYR